MQGYSGLRGVILGFEWVILGYSGLRWVTVGYDGLY